MGGNGTGDPSPTKEDNKKPSDDHPMLGGDHSVSFVLIISASTQSRIKRFRLLPWLAAKSLMT